VTETLESGAEFSDVPMTLEVQSSGATGTSPRTFIVSTAPIERDDGRYALVSVIDLDALRERGHDSVRNDHA